MEYFTCYTSTRYLPDCSFGYDDEEPDGEYCSRSNVTVVQTDAGNESMCQQIFSVKDDGMLVNRCVRKHYEQNKDAKKLSVSEILQSPSNP